MPHWTRFDGDNEGYVPRSELQAGFSIAQKPSLGVRSGLSGTAAQETNRAGRGREALTDAAAAKDAIHSMV